MLFALCQDVVLLYEDVGALAVNELCILFCWNEIMFNVFKKCAIYRYSGYQVTTLHILLRNCIMFYFTVSQPYATVYGYNIIQRYSWSALKLYFEVIDTCTWEQRCSPTCMCLNISSKLLCFTTALFIRMYFTVV